MHALHICYLLSQCYAAARRNALQAQWPALPCRSQGQGASGIVYVLSRDDTAVVASYLKVILPPTLVMQHCTLAIQLSMHTEPHMSAMAWILLQAALAASQAEAARVHKVNCRRVPHSQNKEHGR